MMAMAKLWEKNGKAQNNGNEKLRRKAEEFTVGNDYILDLDLIPYDIRASKVHAEGLVKAGVLSAGERDTLKRGLDELLHQWEMGEFTIEKSQEDGHTAIEQKLIAEVGEVGKMIHTARSRNDQVLVALRLYERERLDEISEMTVDLAQEFISFADEHKEVPLPGYTHTQRAMLASVGMWSASFAEMLIQDLELLKAAYKNVNRCPLGTAAGFGVNFELPRDYVSQRLGFDQPITVSMTAQSTRGKVEAQILAAITSISATLARFASDLLMFTSREFDFFALDDALCTGSSIMPQKRNLDTAEILRARHATLLGYEQQLKMVTHNLISGYHRDLQLTKEPVMKALVSIYEMLSISCSMVEGLEPNAERLNEACTSELFAADRANELVKQGMSFRDAYKEVGEKLEGLEKQNPQENLKGKNHLGATGNLGLERLKKQLNAFRLH